MLFGSSMLIARKCALEKSISLRNNRMTRLTQDIARHKSTQNKYKNALKTQARTEYNIKYNEYLAQGNGQAGSVVANTEAGNDALQASTTLTNQANARAYASNWLENELATIDDQFDEQTDKELQALQDESTDLEIEQNSEKELLEQVKSWLKTAQEWIKEGIQSLFGGGR